MKTITGLTYNDLDAALTKLGYERSAFPDRILYRHPSEKNAALIYPVLPLDSDVRAIDLSATQRILESFGIADSHDLDLALVRLTGEKTFA